MKQEVIKIGKIAAVAGMLVLLIKIALSVILLSTLTVFIFRPTFLSEYFASNTGGSLLSWETATLTSYLHAITGWQLWRFAGILLLPLILWFWFQERLKWSLIDWVDWTILLSLITAPFGWSYDQIVLILPMIRICLWLVKGEASRLERLVVFALLVALYAINFYLRVITINEMLYFWTPLAVAGIYAYCWLRGSRQFTLTSSPQTASSPTAQTT